MSRYRKQERTPPFLSQQGHWSSDFPRRLARLIRPLACALFLQSLLWLPAPALVAQQHRVDSMHTYYRVISVVPIIGKGTHDDPKRPLHVPVPGTRTDLRSGIMAYSMVLSDDKQFAIVEYVGFNRDALKDVLNDKTLKLFEKGKNSPLEILTELQKFRKGFSLDRFGMAVQ